MESNRYTAEIQFFGKRLKAIRKKAGLSQLDLELKCGIDRTEISRIENGLKNVEFTTIVKFVEALQVEISELFTFPLDSATD